MYCGQCGSQVSDTARFCKNCGAKFDQPLEATPMSGPQGAAAMTNPPGGISSPSQQGVTPAPNLQGVTPTPNPQVSAGVVNPQMPPAMAGQWMGNQAPAGVPASPVKPKRKNGKKIALISAIACVVVIVGIVGAVCLTGSTKEPAINEDYFPNKTIRQAILDQVDSNDDQCLSTSEAERVVGLTVTEGKATFVFDDGQEVTAPEWTIASGECTASKLDAESSQKASWWTYFPNLVYLDCSNGGFTKCDFSKNKKLKYVNCGANYIDSIDLSSNTELVSLYCDDDVKVTGLDSNSLYYDDLLVAAKGSCTTGTKTQKTNDREFACGYNTMGQMTVSVLSYGSNSTATTTYTYDSSHRLTVESRESVFTSNGKTTNGTYATIYGYDSNGKVASSTGAADSITYDESGRFKMTTSSLLESSTEKYTWSDKACTRNAASGSGSSAYSYDYNYTFGTNNLLTNLSHSQSGKYPSSYSTDYAYNSLNLMTKMAYTSTSSSSSGSSTTTSEVTTDYDSDNRPVKSVYAHSTSSGKSYTITSTFATNDDGYVTKIDYVTSNSSDTNIVGASLEIAYVKHVGRLADRSAYESPAYEVGYTSHASTLISTVTEGGNQDGCRWVAFGDYGTTLGGSLYTGLVIKNPIEREAERQIGLSSSILNSNSVKLFSYDLEHRS